MSDANDPIYTPPPVTGYRSLSQAEVDLMNRIKAHGEATRALAEDVRSFVVNHQDGAAGSFENPLRSVTLAVEHMQTGFMWLVRAVAKPRSF